MRAFFHHPVVRRARVLFRWCRIVAWLVVLLIVAPLAYLHLVGLPDFVKRPMLQRLEAAGVEAEFSNMQLGWFRGPSIIIENAGFRRAHEALSPRLSARRAEVALNWDSLCHGRMDLRFMEVRDAKLEVPVSENPSESLVLNKINIEMRFETNDVIRLDYCRGVFHGVQLDVIGAVRHAGEMRNWKLPGNGPPVAGTNAAPAANWQKQLKQIAQTLNKIQFSGKPVLEAEMGADGRDPNSFHVELSFATLGATTPWGNANQLAVKAAFARLASPGKQPFLKVETALAELTGPWAHGRRIFTSTFISANEQSNFVAKTDLRADSLNAAMDSSRTNWLRLTRSSWTASAVMASSNFVPLLSSGKLNAANLETPWGASKDVSITFDTVLNTNAPHASASWGPWAQLAPWSLNVQTEVRRMTGPDFRLDRLGFDLHWRAPTVTVDHMQADFNGGHVRGGIALDIPSRELRLNAASDVDPHTLSAFLKPPDRNILAQLTWAAPPKVTADLSAVLPPWGGRTPHGEELLASSVKVAADVSVGPAAYRKFSVTSAGAHIGYTNRVWTADRLSIVRPDGRVDAELTSSVPTQDFHLTFDSSLKPEAILPLLEKSPPWLTNEVVFRQPPIVHAEIQGNWRAPRKLAIAADVRANNFILRRRDFDAVHASVNYSDLILTVQNLTVSNKDCNVQEPWGQADLRSQIITLSNASGTMAPILLRQMLREHPPEFLNHVRFNGQPAVTAFGYFSLTNAAQVAMHFLVDCHGLHYTNLVADHAKGRVDYMGPRVTVTNVVAELYNGGTLMGWVMFDSNRLRGDFFRADLSARNIDISALAIGALTKTNHLEGRLNGDLNLGGGNTSDIGNWNGTGRIHIYDTLLWDLKLFGLLSPVLNAISPGWGHARAREANANFSITNGTISSDDFEMRCTGFSLNFRGTIDKNRIINARLKATLSRSVPLLGPVLSVAFAPLSKMFEYKITGPVADPVLEPVYVPKFVLFLLHPFKSLKSSPDASPPGNGGKTTPP